MGLVKTWWKSIWCEKSEIWNHPSFAWRTRTRLCISCKKPNTHTFSKAPISSNLTHLDLRAVELPFTHCKDLIKQNIPLPFFIHISVPPWEGVSWSHVFAPYVSFPADVSVSRVLIALCSDSPEPEQTLWIGCQDFIFHSYYGAVCLHFMTGWKLWQAGS